MKNSHPVSKENIGKNYLSFNGLFKKNNPQKLTVKKPPANQPKRPKLDILNNDENSFTFSDEIWIKIFQNLNLSDMAKVAEVNQSFKRISEDNLLWLPILKKLKPNLQLATGASYKQAFINSKGRSLQKLFREQYKECILEVPVITREEVEANHKKSIFSLFFKLNQNDTLIILEKLCLQGSEEELKQNLSKLLEEHNLNRVTEAEPKKLLDLATLALNNKKTRNAFKLLMEALKEEVRIYFLKTYYANSKYYYLTLNFILQNITPLEVEKDIPLILSVRNSVAVNILEKDIVRLIKFLTAFDIKCIYYENKNYETLFYIFTLARADQSAEVVVDLAQYFVYEVSKAASDCLIHRDYFTHTPLLLLTKLCNTASTREIEKIYLGLIRHIIKIYPSQLEIFPDGSMLKIILELFKKRELLEEHMEFIMEMNTYFIKNNKGTLLHQSLNFHLLVNEWLITIFNETSDSQRYLYFLNQNKKTLLHIAAMCSRRRIVELLVKYGVEINQIDDEGNTALGKTIAVMCKDMQNKNCIYNMDRKIFKCLLAAKANVNIKYNNEPLINLAIKNKIELEIVASLFLAGADPRQAGLDGKTALDLIQDNFVLRQLAEGALEKIIGSAPKKSALVVENEKLREQLQEMGEQNVTLREENCQLRAEIERLKMGDGAKENNEIITAADGDSSHRLSC